jgi:hypothetical protein
MAKAEAEHRDRRSYGRRPSVLRDDFGLGVKLAGELREASGRTRVQSVGEQ